MSEQRESRVYKTVVLDQLCEIVADMLAMRMRKYAVKKQVSIILYGYAPVLDDNDSPVLDESGKPLLNENLPKQLVEISGFEKILRKAREILRDRACISFQDARADSVGLYEKIIADPLSTDSIKLRAQENLDKIFNIVKQTNIGTPHGLVDLDSLDLPLDTKLILLDAVRKQNEAESSVSNP